MKTIKGDLLQLFDQGQFNVIMHGCNCYNVMGAGIAKQIALKYPQARIIDSMTKKRDILKLGDFTVATIRDQMIFNLYTQYRLGPNFHNSHLRDALQKVSKYLEKFDQVKIGLPMIGCGIGGGDWNYVQYTIQQTLKDYDVTIVEYQPNECMVRCINKL